MFPIISDVLVTAVEPRLAMATGARPKQSQAKFNMEYADHNFALEAGAARRRKRRAGAGQRSVEVVRGRYGFGFTLSGQAPCVLSSVITGSPAERVGLQSGHTLLAVNGRNVSRLPHSEVTAGYWCLSKAIIEL